MAEDKKYTVNLKSYTTLGRPAVIPYIGQLSPVNGYTPEKWLFLLFAKNANIWMTDASTGKPITMKNIKDYYPEEGGGGDDPQPGGDSKLEGFLVPHLEIGEGEYDVAISDGTVTPYPVTEDT